MTNTKGVDKDTHQKQNNSLDYKIVILDVPYNQINGIENAVAIKQNVYAKPDLLKEKKMQKRKVIYRKNH